MKKQKNKKKKTSLPFFSFHWIHLIIWLAKPNVLLRSAKVNAHQMAENRVSGEAGETLSWKCIRLQSRGRSIRGFSAFDTEKSSLNWNPWKSNCLFNTSRAALSHGAPHFAKHIESNGRFEYLHASNYLQSPLLGHGQRAWCWAHNVGLASWQEQWKWHATSVKAEILGRSWAPVDHLYTMMLSSPQPLCLS